MTFEPPRSGQPAQSLSGSVPAQPSPPETTPPPETAPLPAPAPGPETSPEPAPAPEVPPSVEPPAVPTGSPSTVTVPAGTPTPGGEPSGAETPAAKSDDKDAHQTKVRIDTPGATIEIEANEPLSEVVATALRLFHEAGGWPQVPYRSAGFAQAERRDTLPVQPSSMPYGPGSYPIQMP
ncbi:hypothetical protein [Plantactinospora sp. B5E13]|uniref:hypothetical protein n=1 Tax=unclassified Plantactinospora TaxID=2631981 RepID=UPI00325D3D83